MSPVDTAVRRALASALGLSFAAGVPALDASPRPRRARAAAVSAVSAASVVGGGPHFGNPVAIGVEASGSYVVADTNWRTLLRVNPLTGQRAPIGPAVLPIPGRRATAIGPEETGALMVGETTGSGDFGLDATLARYGAQGERTVVSGDGRGSGPTLIAPAALARETGGAWLLADRERRTLYRIDPATGDRTVVSGCVNHADDCTQPLIGSGPQLTATTGLALEGTGMLLVGQPGLLLRVDPGAGDRTALSGGGVGSGPSLGTPAAVAVEASGTVLWADATSRALLRIDPGSGARTIVSGPAAGSGAPFKSVSGLAIEQETVGLVVDAVQGLVLKVDLATGDRTPFSGGPMSGGDALGCVSGLVVEASGAVVGSDACSASVVRIDAASGDRTLVSGAARGGGPALSAVLDITRESSGSLVVVDPGGLVRIDAGSGDRTDIEGGGEPLRGPLHVAAEPSGSLAVFTAGVERCLGFPRPFWCWRVGKGVVRVDADTGEGTMVSGGGPTGRRRGRGPGFGRDLRDIAVEHDGGIIVALHDTLYRVDPVSGDRTRAVREACCRVRITTPGSVAVEPTGMLAVADRWALKRVDPGTRRISMLSGEEFADGEAFVAGVGPEFELLTAVAVDAGGTLWVASAHPVLPGAAALLRVDPVTGDRSYVSR